MFAVIASSDPGCADQGPVPGSEPVPVPLQRLPSRYAHPLMAFNQNVRILGTRSRRMRQD